MSDWLTFTLIILTVVPALGAACFAIWRFERVIRLLMAREAAADERARLRIARNDANAKPGPEPFPGRKPIAVDAVLAGTGNRFMRTGIDGPK